MPANFAEATGNETLLVELQILAWKKNSLISGGTGSSLLATSLAVVVICSGFFGRRLH